MTFRCQKHYDKIFVIKWPSLQSLFKLNSHNSLKFPSSCHYKRTFIKIILILWMRRYAFKEGSTLSLSFLPNRPPTFGHFAAFADSFIHSSSAPARHWTKLIFIDSGSPRKLMLHTGRGSARLGETRIARFGDGATLYSTQLPQMWPEMANWF